MRPLQRFPLLILTALLLPHVCASMTWAQGTPQPFPSGKRIQQNLSLRGGNEEGKVAKLGELAMLVSNEWNKIPQEKRRDLASFVIKTIHPAASDPLAHSAVGTAAALLALRVLRKFFPYWQDLFARLERIMSAGGANRDQQMATAVREGSEACLSKAIGTSVTIKTVTLPTEKGKQGKHVAIVEGIRVANPAGFRSGQAAMSIGRVEVEANMRLPPEAFSSKTLTLLEVNTVKLSGMVVRVEVASFKNLFSGENRTNLEAISKSLDHSKKQMEKVSKVLPREGGKMMLGLLEMRNCSIHLASANADESLTFKMADVTLDLGGEAIFPEELPSAIWAAVVREISRKVADLNPMGEKGIATMIRNETVAVLQKAIAQSVDNMETQRELLSSAAGHMGDAVKQFGTHIGGFFDTLLSRPPASASSGHASSGPPTPPAGASESEGAGESAQAAGDGVEGLMDDLGISGAAGQGE